MVYHERNFVPIFRESRVILEVETRDTGCMAILMCLKKYFPLDKTEYTRQMLADYGEEMNFYHDSFCLVTGS